MELKEKILAWVGKNKFVILALLVGVIILLIPQRTEEKVSETVIATQPETTDITEELTQILSQIDGAGKVKVMLTVQTGQTTVYQFDQSVSGGETGTNNQDTVIITDKDRGQSGLVQRVDPPRYLGAVVVCSGAESALVRLSIIEAVSKVTGLGADRISVLKMK